jgi:hypothetical protein
MYKIGNVVIFYDMVSAHLYHLTCQMLSEYPLTPNYQILYDSRIVDGGWLESKPNGKIQYTNRITHMKDIIKSKNNCSPVLTKHNAYIFL